MEDKNKVQKVLSNLKGLEFWDSIPVHLWVTNMEKVKRYLKSGEKLLPKK
ncbi:hypothetical protein M2132_002473 [Dysgonomonas sp. PH5-45]|nr:MULTISPECIES: hypothetical protein [unclassified Dysgonomonas]MDH6356110.1 hypothetical protein [Dysgonomonas sp. PH5-45]MDH6389005.1 hypothetical protein [Dysgonomonas sp. PH5-37]